jgi:hypothetical protein
MAVRALSKVKADLLLEVPVQTPPVEKRPAAEAEI